MKKDTVFFRQAELLLRVLPSVNEEEVFALKGGTAINFFLRDLPRLSVDIDLTYLPVNDRETALIDNDDSNPFPSCDRLTDQPDRVFNYLRIQHYSTISLIITDEQGKEIRPGSEESLPLYRSRKGLSSLSGGR